LKLNRQSLSLPIAIIEEALSERAACSEIKTKALRNKESVSGRRLRYIAKIARLRAIRKT